jgi:hypothetical protein
MAQHPFAKLGSVDEFFDIKEGVDLPVSATGLSLEISCKSIQFWSH